jgi:iron complex outermembrane receptor protein
MSLAGTAFAQESGSQANPEHAKKLETVTVTGSRIPRTDTETPSPVQVITRQEIDRSGKTTIAEYLQTLTVDGQGSVPKSFGSGFSAGGAGISLRGLGAGSTLVLLNGRRMASYGLADDGQKIYTDLSTIPLDAVERVEVLKDGASAIYGSDAIAGVVNIILRHEFQGVTAKASYGTSEEGGGAIRKLSLTGGFGELGKDRFNVFGTLDLGKSDNIKISDRRDRKWIGTGDIRPWGYPITSSGLAGYVNPTSGVPANPPTGAVRKPDGTYQILPGCSKFSTLNPPDPKGGCLWEVGRFRDLSPSEEYVNFFGRGTFAIDDKAEAYAELSLSRKKTEFTSTPSGVTGSWGYPGGAVVTTSGPDAMLIAGRHPDNLTRAAGRIRYSAWDAGPRVNKNDTDFVRLLAGVKGSFGEWDYDVGVLHSESNTETTRLGYLLNSRVRTVLNNPNSPVGWWRIGENAGLNSQALYDYISPTLHAKGDSSLDSIDARLSGSLATLPGGPLGVAVGVEYRRQKVTLTPTTYTNVGDVIGLGYSAYDGTEEVGVAFAEFTAPLLESLELNGAARVDSYKNGDTVVTPKTGFKWKATNWLALRGTYGQGFRAPNPAETAGRLAAFSTASDPVRCPGGNAFPGASPKPTCGAASVALITSGNTQLKPEKSESYTAGFVLEPVSGTSITVDAWKIKRTNEINTETTGSALAAGRAVRGDDNLLVNGVPVPNTGSLLAVLTQYINSSSTTVQGVDTDVRQRFDLGDAGQLRLDLQWSHINSFKRIDGDEKFEFAGTHGNCDVTNCIGTPKDRVNFGATWDYHDKFSVNSVVNYRSSFKNVMYKDDPNGCAAHFADDTAAPKGCRIPSFYTIDVSGNWNVTKQWQVFGSIQNLTDKIAPLDPTTYGAINYNPLDFSGAVGRYYTLGVKYAFK